MIIFIYKNVQEICIHSQVSFLDWQNIYRIVIQLFQLMLPILAAMHFHQDPHHLVLIAVDWKSRQRMQKYDTKNPGFVQYNIDATCQYHCKHHDILTLQLSIKDFVVLRYGLFTDLPSFSPRQRKKLKPVNAMTLEVTRNPSLLY